MLVEEQKECIGPGIFMGDAIDPIVCAEACKGKSTMFIHGRKEVGEYGCFCEILARPYGLCGSISQPAYNLYKYGMRKTKCIFYER